MPYKGVRCRSEKLIINVKVFRPDHEFDFTTSELVENVGMVVKTDGIPSDSSAAIKIAELLSPKLFLDHDVPWFEVEVIDNEGGVYGVSALNEDTREYESVVRS